MRSIGIFANPYKKLLKEKLPKLIQFLNNEDMNVYFPFGVFKNISPDTLPCTLMAAEEIPANCDIILTFGGDGTVLRTAQLVKNHQKPILAVNVGGLGFLTEIQLDDFESAFRLILQENYRIEERVMLEAKIEGDERPLHALNEITIEKGRSPRVIEIKVDIDGRYFNDYVADGLIISTPTGSTGYSLSTGGPIVVPTSDCLILNPICPHSLTNRPVIIPTQSQMKAKIYTDYPEIIVAGDSQDIREFPSKTVLNIQMAPFHTRLIKYKDSDYFSLLRSKLAWGEDFRNKLRWSSNR
jgi:NAD+ kinase